MVALLAVTGACRKKVDPVPSPPKPWAPPELSGTEPILIPPNAGRFLLQPPGAPLASEPDVRKATVVAKICVSRTGNVDHVDLVESFSPAVDDPLIAYLKTWKHNPYQVGGQPKSFCYVMRFTYEKGQQPLWSY